MKTLCALFFSLSVALFVPGLAKADSQLPELPPIEPTPLSFTPQRCAEIVAGTPASGICRGEYDPIDLRDLPAGPPLGKCREFDVAIQSPGGTSCNGATDALRRRYLAAIANFDTGTCGTYVTGVKGVDSFIASTAFNGLACCLNKERCQYVTQGVRVRLLERYRDTASQLSCHRAVCSMRGGVFRQRCSVADLAGDNVEAYPIRSATTCEDVQTACCIKPRPLDPVINGGTQPVNIAIAPPPLPDPVGGPEPTLAPVPMIEPEPTPTPAPIQSILR